jgi:4-amino-4-deoxy-L-arabinose transferase-like glycosyltransferase
MRIFEVMQNNPEYILLSGCIILLFSLISFFKSNQNTALAALIVSAAFLRIYASLDIGLHDWDEKFHALVAKNMINNPIEPRLYRVPILHYNYKIWISNYIWLHKPPLTLWFMSLSISSFGLNELAVRIPSILLSSLSVYLVYFIARFVKNEIVAYFAAFLFAINGFIIELAAGRMPSDHIDSVFIFMFLLIIFSTIKWIKSSDFKHSLIVGIVLGVAALSKWLIAYFALPLILILMFYFKLTFSSICKRMLLITGISLILVVPWHVYIHYYYPQEASWESAHNFKHIFEVLEGNGGSVFFYLNQIRINYHDLIYFPLIWFASMIFKNRNDHKLQFLLTWFLFPILFFTMAKTKLPAYLVFTAASYFIIVSLFCFELYNKIWIHKWFRYALLSLMISLQIIYSIERIKPFQNQKDALWIKQLKEHDKKYSGKWVLMNYQAPIDAMFYTNFIVYEYCPTQEMINEIFAKGYRVLINAKPEDNLYHLINAKFVQISLPD